MILSCPRCGWSNIRPSQLSGPVDYLLRACLLSPFRCRCCRHRFYRYHGYARENGLKKKVGIPLTWSPALVAADLREKDKSSVTAPLARQPEPETRRAEPECEVRETEAPMCRLVFTATVRERRPIPSRQPVR